MNLYIISTPSQAFFLSQTPHLIGPDSFLFIPKSRVDYNEKILFYLKKFPWKKIIIIDVVGAEQPSGYYKIIRYSILINFLFKTKFKKINKIFIGSYNNSFILGIAALLEKQAEIYLLYDGLQMVTVNNERKQELNNFIRPYTSVFILAGFKKPILQSITFVSPLDLEVSPKDNFIKISPIKYPSPTLQPDVIYFVGQPLVEVKILSLRTYLHKLNLVKNRFQNCKIIYIPHPKESIENINSIIGIFEVLYLDRIFEEKYLQSNFFPQTIISFYSSVLINLCYLEAKTNIYAIEIYSDEIEKINRIESISQIYEFFKMVKYPKFKILEF